MFSFTIDLLWVRPGKVGGTEVVIRNLLDGFELLSDSFKAILIVSHDNADTFRHYVDEDKRYEMVEADIYSENILKRIIWQNMHLNALIRRTGVCRCFSPVYDRPVFNGGVKYINVIHDIQAYYFPQYHPFYEVFYSKLLWRVDRDKSEEIICISDCITEDIKRVYHFKPEKIITIYDPVAIDEKRYCDFSDLKIKYGIEEHNYYYTVSQLIKHKNIGTILKVMRKIKGVNGFPQKLIISGIDGNAKEELDKYIEALGIKDNVIFTGYVQDDIRNTLYRYSKAFLFPSVYEGFGIPPVEAMLCGASVVTTKCSGIPKITQDKAAYVNDPYDVDEWIECIAKAVNRSDEIDASIYSKKKVAEEFFKTLDMIWG